MYPKQKNSPSRDPPKKGAPIIVGNPHILSQLGAMSHLGFEILNLVDVQVDTKSLQLVQGFCGGLGGQGFPRVR